MYSCVDLGCKGPGKKMMAKRLGIAELARDIESKVLVLPGCKRMRPL
jgi:hypothetical protein